MNSLQISKFGLHLTGDGSKVHDEDSKSPVRTPAPEDAGEIKAKSFMGLVTFAVASSEIPWI